MTSIIKAVQEGREEEPEGMWWELLGLGDARKYPDARGATLELIRAAAALPPIEARWALVERLHEARSGCVATAGAFALW